MIDVKFEVFTAVETEVNSLGLRCCIVLW